ncbi:MAG: iron-containing alcohol dehydrogenase [Acidobacteriaceae bacterium]|nr:iron-containing alcohol dehydrogenase [Acidobacteriaceae bacterium]
MQFEFRSATRILFGPGTVSEIPALVRNLGARALLVTGSNPQRAKPVLDALSAASVRTAIFRCPGEPTVELVREGVRAAGECEVIVGLGGGSAIDCAKAIAILATNSGEPLDYLEVNGKGRPLENAPLAFVAIPTTAGTGAEVTRNAVLESSEHKVKASLRSPLMPAKIAVVDPDLTLDLPPEVTASTGLDTLTQLIEPFVSIRANAFTDMFCREGLPQVANALETAFHDGRNKTARTSMSYASLLSGLALSNAGLGVIHGFAAPLGGSLHAPHGALCASVLPYGMAANIAALRQRAPEDTALEKYKQVARMLTGREDAQPEDGVTWVASLCRRLSIRALEDYGLSADQIPALVENAARASSTKANPIVLTPKELTRVAQRALTADSIEF